MGLDGFRSIIEGNYTFVDKSMLVAEFIKRSPLVSLILRPRRFGKSINLSMLRYFFEKTNTERPRSAGEKTRHQLFEGLRLESEMPRLFESHFAKHPVIYFSLKDMKSLTWMSMLEKTRNLMSTLYRSHQYVYSSLGEYDKADFNSIIKQDSTYSNLEAGLRELSRYLKEYHKAKCVILFDEYDSPLDSAFDNGYYEDAKDFFAGMFSLLLKSNDENVYKAFLVGVLRIAKSGFLSGLNNLSVYPMYSTEYSDKFGFTSEEVSLLTKIWD